MSKTISDIIEEFIMSSLDDDKFIELSRNDLAKFFSCVPSQINYVLNTRFTVNRGFMVESQRGGGGYIKVVRVQDNNSNFLRNALEIDTNIFVERNTSTSTKISMLRKFFKAYAANEEALVFYLKDVEVKR